MRKLACREEREKGEDGGMKRNETGRRRGERGEDRGMRSNEIGRRRGGEKERRGKTGRTSEKGNGEGGKQLSRVVRIKRKELHIYLQFSQHSLQHQCLASTTVTIHVQRGAHSTARLGGHCTGSIKWQEAKPQP